MLGRNAMPRWRLPGWLMLGLMLSGCAARTESGGTNSTLPIPSVRMALVKIPLNRGEPDVFDDQDPLKRFTAEPVAVAHTPNW